MSIDFDLDIFLTNQCSTECMWCQQKKSLTDGRKDGQKKSDPYVALCLLMTQKLTCMQVHTV